MQAGRATLARRSHLMLAAGRRAGRAPPRARRAPRARRGRAGRARPRACDPGSVELVEGSASSASNPTSCSPTSSGSSAPSRSPPSSGSSASTGSASSCRAGRPCSPPSRTPPAASSWSRWSPVLAAVERVERHLVLAAGPSSWSSATSCSQPGELGAGRARRGERVELSSWSPVLAAEQERRRRRGALVFVRAGGAS